MKTPAIILAGGLGMRLRSVDSERPKPMVLVEGKPFLHWFILNLVRKEYDHFIFSVGYKADYITEYEWSQEFPEIKFEFVKEEEPLGTGGAVQKVFARFSDLGSAWVFNGDTLLDNPLPPKEMDDDVHYVCLEEARLFDAKPNVCIDGDRVIGIGDSGKYFDAGQVFVTRDAVEKYTGGLPVSLHRLVEKSFFERQAGYTVVDGTCYDIGTPERLERLKVKLKL